MPKLVTLLILAVVLIIAGLTVTNASMSQYLTALISLAALIVSVVSAFKDDVFPFRPRALFDEILLAGPSTSSQNNPALLVPIAFLNEGYGSGVVEGLTLKVENRLTAKIYTPVLEVDHQKFMSGKRALHGENTVGAFNSFALVSRDTLKKSIVFTQEQNSAHFPLSAWSPGEYVFRLFMKHSGAKSPVEVGTVTYEISAQLLADYNFGTSVSLSPSRELHV